MAHLAASMVAGTSRSPRQTSTPACTSPVTFSGLRTSTRTGAPRWASRRDASAPIFPAVVTRIMVVPLYGSGDLLRRVPNRALWPGAGAGIEVRGSCGDPDRGSGHGKLHEP